MCTRRTEQLLRQTRQPCLMQLCVCSWIDSCLVDMFFDVSKDADRKKPMFLNMFVDSGFCVWFVCMKACLDLGKCNIKSVFSFSENVNCRQIHLRSVLGRRGHSLRIYVVSFCFCFSTFSNFAAKSNYLFYKLHKIISSCTINLNFIIQRVYLG